MAEKNGLIRVLIADDHPIVRKGLRGLIDSEPGMQVVGEAADGIEAVRQVRLLDPDVIVLDLLMPRQDGIAAIDEIRQYDPSAGILVLTSYAGDDRAVTAVRSGARGYLPKDSSPQDLLDAIRQVAKGQVLLSAAIASRLVGEINQPSNQYIGRSLSQREAEVLVLLASGLSNQEIATSLGLSERTARNHVSAILGKLNLASRTQAAVYAVREGLATIDDGAERTA